MTHRSAGAAAKERFRFVDLFAGLGGFHVAMERLGGECVFASEWDVTLQRLYEKNFGITPTGDITKVDIKDVPNHDVLCAGFPCQPFSKAGEQLGFEHTEQGELFFNVRDIIAERRPAAFVLENVPNILKHDEGRTWEKISSELRSLNYLVDEQRYSPDQFGVPQIRERVYIVGLRSDLTSQESDFALPWPEPPHPETTIFSVLAPNGDGKALPSNVVKVLETWNLFLKLFPKDSDIPSFPLWSMEFGATYPFREGTPLTMLDTEGPKALHGYRGIFGAPLDGLNREEILELLPSHAKRPGSSFPQWKIKFLEQNRAFFNQHKAWLEEWLPEIQGFASSHQKFEWNAKGEERDVWKHVIQFRASGVRIKRERTAPSLIAMTDTQVPIIGKYRRYMSPSECARLQDLDGIAMPDAPTRAFRALGNAVNAKVVQEIAGPMLDAVLESDRSELRLAAHRESTELVSA